MTPQYEVRTVGEIPKKAVQLAFVLDDDSWTIWISRSGHGAILREAGLTAHNCRGGWVRPVQGRISGDSGLLGGVRRRDLLSVADAIGRVLGTQLRLGDQLQEE
jgi:hypothetical protein